ncbi:hypothetical protein [Olivibacter ginsenosidimutans]
MDKQIKEEYVVGYFAFHQWGLSHATSAILNLMAFIFLILALMQENG